MTRVLVVEDDAACSDLARALRAEGHDVETATPGPPLLTTLDVEEALAHACDGAANLEERLRQCFREARPVRVGGGWHRPFALLLALSVALAPALARADDVAPPPAAAGVPGQSVEIEQGAPAPFKGNLADATRWAFVRQLRTQAEKERDALRLSEQDARARRDAAERERDGRPSWGALVGVAGAALVLGLVAGVVGVVVVQDRVK